MPTANRSATAPRRPRLMLHRPAEDLDHSTRWLVNGFPATVLIWTAEAWAGLTDRPEHAQLSPAGLWCLLRID